MIETSLVGFRSCNFTFPAVGVGTEKDCDEALEAFETFYKAMVRLHRAAKKAAPVAEHPVLREQITDAEVPQVFRFLASVWNARRYSRSRASFAHRQMHALSRRYAEAPREEAWPEDAPVAAAEEEAASAAFDLQVEVLSALDLGSPDYRLGDVTRSVANSLLGGRKNKLDKVYATVKLGGGGLTVRTPLASCPRDAEHPSVHFCEDRHCLSYGDEQELVVEVFDKRDVQAKVRGDPKVGHGTLVLGHGEAPDGQPHTAEVPLVNGDASAGKVLLRYQFVRYFDSAD